MPAPLIVAGAKVAAKKVATKVAAKQAAKIAAKKVATEAGKKVAQKGAETAVKNKLASSASKAKNWYNQGQKIQDIKDNIPSNQKEQEEKQTKLPPKKNILDRFLKSDQKIDKDKIDIDKRETPEKLNWRKTIGLDKQDKSSVNPNAKEPDNKLTFYSAMFFALVKDGLEIALSFWLMGWLIPIVSFLPTVILTAILFLSGKKSTMKMVMFLVALFIDYLFPGVNALPITTIAVFITFKLTPKATELVKSDDINKGLKVIKSFIK